MVSLLT